MGDIGKRIRTRRIELDMTVEDVAKLIGKDRATVYRYENGDIENLPLTVLIPLAEALKTTPSDLMGYTNDNSSSEIEGRKIASTIIDSDIQKYEQLSDDDKKMVIDVIRRLYDGQVKKE